MPRCAMAMLAKRGRLAARHDRRPGCAQLRVYCMRRKGTRNGIGDDVPLIRSKPIPAVEERQLGRSARSAWGYRRVPWYPDGTDEWEEAKLPFERRDPVPRPRE